MMSEWFLILILGGEIRAFKYPDAGACLGALESMRMGSIPTVAFCAPDPRPTSHGK